MRLRSALFSCLVSLATVALIAGCGSSSKSTSNTLPTPGGSPAPTPGSPAPAPSPSGKQQEVFVASAGANNVFAFNIESGGAVAPVGGSPFAVPSDGVAVDGSRPVAFSTNATTLASLAINPDGSLKQTSAVTGEWFGTLYTDISGNNLYANSPSADAQPPMNNGIDFFDVNANGSLKMIGGTVLFGASRGAFTPDNSTVYVPNCYHLSPAITQFTHNPDGTLSMTQNSVPPPTMGPNGQCVMAVAVAPGGNFAVAVWNTPSFNELISYTINPSTHALTQASTFNIGTAGFDLAFDSSGKWIVVAQDDGVKTYSFNAGTMAAGPAPPPSSHADRVVFSPSGQFIVAANRAGNQVWVFTFDASFGMLAVGPGSPVAVTAPADLAALQH